MSQQVAPDTEPLVDSEFISKLLGVSKEWVQKAAARKLIPSYRVGKFLKFRESEIRAWVEERAVKADPGKGNPFVFDKRGNRS